MSSREGTRCAGARSRRGTAAGPLVGLVSLALAGCALPADPTAAGVAEVRAERDAAAAQAHEAALDRAAVFLRDKWGPVALPDEPIVRWVTVGEWGPAMARCLGESGFPGVRPADDGERLDYSGARVQSTREFFEIDVAGWVCQARYPVLTWFEDDVRAIEAPWAFEYVRASLVPCLLAHGYEVPTAPGPREFADRWRTDAAFDPYALVGEAAGDRARAAARCPAPETVLEGAG